MELLYDPSLIDHDAEVIPLKDQTLKNNWKRDKLYRIVLRLLAPGDRAEWEILFQKS